MNIFSGVNLGSWCYLNQVDPDYKGLPTKIYHVHNTFKTVTYLPCRVGNILYRPHAVYNY